MGGPGPFGPVQDVFGPLRAFSGLLETGQLQGRWLDPFGFLDIFFNEQNLKNDHFRKIVA